jgi:hypothetical protein
MATAKELLLAYMDLIRNPEEAISLFALDAAIEIPYLVEVGLPGNSKGARRFWASSDRSMGYFQTWLSGMCSSSWNHQIKRLASTRFIAQPRRLKGNITNCFSEDSWRRAARSSCCARRSTSSVLRKPFFPMVCPMSRFREAPRCEASSFNPKYS